MAQSSIDVVVEAQTDLMAQYDVDGIDLLPSDTSGWPLAPAGSFSAWWSTANANPELVAPSFRPIGAPPGVALCVTLSLEGRSPGRERRPALVWEPLG